jgi:tetratricopeptide (TPR) repeat protein
MKYLFVALVFCIFSVSCVVEERNETRISVDPSTFDVDEIDTQYNEMSGRAAASASDSEARIWLGDYHFFKMKDAKAALPWYEQATVADPKSATAWFKVGVANAVLENKAAAESAFNKAVECDPEYAPAYLNLSRIYEERKDFARASEYREKYFNCPKR